MGRVWIFQGGWDGHEPVQTSARFKAMLEKHGYEVTVFDTLEPLGSLSDLMELELMNTRATCRRRWPRAWA